MFRRNFPPYLHGRKVIILPWKTEIAGSSESLVTRKHCHIPEVPSLWMQVYPKVWWHENIVTYQKYPRYGSRFIRKFGDTKTLSHTRSTLVMEAGSSESLVTRKHCHIPEVPSLWKKVHCTIIWTSSSHWKYTFSTHSVHVQYTFRPSRLPVFHSVNNTWPSQIT